MLIIGPNLRLQPVREEDSEFIFSIRTDKSISRYLSRIDSQLESQRLWIGDYLDRERRGEELYFLIMDLNGHRLGTVRLYNFKHPDFEWGSFIVLPSNFRFAALEAALLSLDYAFFGMNFERCVLNVDVDNARALNFYRRFGFVEGKLDKDVIWMDYSRTLHLTNRSNVYRILTEARCNETV